MSHAKDVQRNRDVWTKANAEYTDAKARESWARDEIDWGMFSGPESDLNALGDVAGKDVVELGCGTRVLRGVARQARRRHWSIRRLRSRDSAAHEPRVRPADAEFVEASGGDVPLPDASFDLAGSEYGVDLGRP